MAISHVQSISEERISPDWLENLSTTPAFVFDEKRLSKNLSKLAHIGSTSGSHILYSIKACPFISLLKQIHEYVEGFSVSSLFEARLAHDVTQGAGQLHITTPGFKQSEMIEIGNLCDAVSFNSLNQLQRLPFHLGGRAKIGLRVNPQRSFLDDPRYDPCRAHSKLGVPLSQLVEGWSSEQNLLRTVNGLHLHTNFCSNSFAPLQVTIAHIEERLPEMVRQIDWINLGGGYQFQAIEDLETLYATIQHIRTVWQAEVFLEPGHSVVNDAGLLVATVIDTFESEGKSIAVLDTSVNHLPAVFEYQIKPTLRGAMNAGPYPVTLAGSTCLSGDLFGEYHFAKPLVLGDRVIFENAGAYSLIKASRFNGLNLPSIHFLDERNNLTLMKSYSYEDYRQQWSERENPHQSSQSKTG